MVYDGSLDLLMLFSWFLFKTIIYTILPTLTDGLYLILGWTCNYADVIYSQLGAVLFFI